MELLKRVSAVNNNVIVVLFAGRPIEVALIESLAKAVLYVWMPGTEGAVAITDVLFGVKEPTCRLASLCIIIGFKGADREIRVILRHFA